MRPNAGFTLIELLCVCAILAALSYVAWGAYLNVDRRAEDQLARAQLLQLADALKRFHADTGYWPGEGPWRLVSEGGGGAIAAGSFGVKYGSGGSNDAQLAAWLASPANLFLLYERPALDDTHPLRFLENWNPETHRGWNGPYLPLANRHWVDVWADLGKPDDAQESAPGSGSPRFIVPALGAGPKFWPVRGNNAACHQGGTGCFLVWRGNLPDAQGGVFDGDEPGSSISTQLGEEILEFNYHARPFLFLLDPPRVVYWGADGVYGGKNTATAGYACQANADEPGGADDVVICL
ncbi:MAG: prepilin-type N-terminal cleavage/methylation domain-containing protein [Azoarcus sp.]|jgi:prepilin-type N-terminal cleavage/methylation domain-containing protein|nr:prepilin-type N-terminal cleavage/methylation domain-containing protein [Azoarcus sp.]